ncbi:MAG: class I SAM-dependent methyltransferase, partial [Chthoniobacterales bacterium]
LGSKSRTLVMAEDENNKDASIRHLHGGPMLYPDERATAIVARHFSPREKNAGKRALDVGCGGGRHLKLLLDFGFDTYGLDYIEEACVEARSLFESAPGFREVRQADLRNSGFEEGSFDLILAWGVVFLRPLDELRADLLILRKLLKPGGVLAATFRTKANWFYGLGEPVSPHTFRLDDRAKDYRDMIFTFLDLPEVETALQEAGLGITTWEKVELTKGNGKELNSWLMIAAKPL